MYNCSVQYTMTNDAGGFLHFMQAVTFRVTGNLYFEKVDFNYVGTYYGGGLMALNCPLCNVTFKSCNLSKGGVGGLDTGTGTANDGGFFYITAVKVFTLKDVNLFDLSLEPLVNIFVNISGLQKDAAEYQKNFGTLILYSEITSSTTFIFENLDLSFN